MFRDKVRHPLPADDDEVREILCDAIEGAVAHGSGQWFYDVGAGHAETLAVGLDEPYGDIVALLRMDEHCPPSEGYDKSFAAITVMPRARAHRARQEGRWVQSIEPIAQYTSRPSEKTNCFLLTYTTANRPASELLDPEAVDERVAELIAEGADPLSFVVWERRSPEERKVQVRVRY